MIFFRINLWKWWYLIAICFVFGKHLLDFATTMQIWLSSMTLQKTSGIGRWISKINYTSIVSAIEVLRCASPVSMWYTTLLVYLYQFIFVTYYITIMDIPRTKLHILYVTWHFLHYRNLLELIHWKSWHLCNTGYIFIYWDCKLHPVWVTVKLHLVNSHM